jgi:hypothetical protein
MFGCTLVHMNCQYPSTLLQYKVLTGEINLPILLDYFHQPPYGHAILSSANVMTSAHLPHLEEARGTYHTSYNTNF